MRRGVPAVSSRWGPARTPSPPQTPTRGRRSWDGVAVGFGTYMGPRYSSWDSTSGFSIICNFKITKCLRKYIITSKSQV